MRALFVRMNANDGRLVFVITVSSTHMHSVVECLLISSGSFNGRRWSCSVHYVFLCKQQASLVMTGTSVSPGKSKSLFLNSCQYRLLGDNASTDINIMPACFVKTHIGSRKFKMVAIVQEIWIKHWYIPTSGWLVNQTCMAAINRNTCMQYRICQLVTSQRGSAWQCYIGRWRSKGKPAFFYQSACINQWKFWNQFWHRWLRWWDLQARQIWFRSVHRGRLHTVVKYHTFVTFVLPFFFIFFFFSVSSSRLQVAILNRFTR